MASSIMHLAVAAELAKRYEFKDLDRLKLGVILPDAGKNGHFFTYSWGLNKKSYNFEFYREKFGELMGGHDDIWYATNGEIMRYLADPTQNVDGEGLDAEGAAVVVIECKTGDVLVCASYPTFDLSTLNQSYAEATRLLTENRRLLDEISEFLLAKETITGDELMAYINADKQPKEETETVE